MPPGIAAIFLAAPMAAVMSTADSLLILATAAIVKDLWKNYVAGDDPVKNEKYDKNVKLVSTILTRRGGDGSHDQSAGYNFHAQYVCIWRT